MYVYIKIFQSTLDTSLRDLHYKIVIGVLLTNTLLGIYHVSYLCTFVNVLRSPLAGDTNKVYTV